MRPYQLSEDEVASRVEQYHSADVTEGLYRFGTMMIQESLDRTKQLEAKTTTVAGYSGAILALLISRPPAWLINPHGWQGILVMCASVFAFLAIVCSLFALRVREHRWFSDSQWFEDEKGVLDNADRQKRYYVLAMHGINQRMDCSNERKANWIFAAQVFLGLAGLCVAVVFLASALLQWLPLFYQWIQS